MRTGARRRTIVRRSLICAVAIVATGCGDDRPSASDWAAEWHRERARVPSVEEFLAGGQALCDGLVGELRLSLGELTPAPVEALDDAVKAWVDEAESIAFECPHDPGVLGERLSELDVLAAEIDAGLAAELD